MKDFIDSSCRWRYKLQGTLSEIIPLFLRSLSVHLQSTYVARVIPQIYWNFVMYYSIPGMIGYLLLFTVAATCEPLCTGAVAEELILSGADLSNWREPHGSWQVVKSAQLDPENPRRLIVEPGIGALTNTPMGGTRHLFSKEEFGDLRAHIEFMVPQGSNSGVYFQGRYEIQICDSWGQEEMKPNSCGAIYQRWEGGRGFEGSTPNDNVCRKPGEWQTLDVIFRAPRFDEQGNKTANARFERVEMNGHVVHPPDVQLSGPTRSAPIWDSERPTGPLMLQGDHGPVVFRNIRLTLLKE